MAQNTWHHVEYYNEHFSYILVPILIITPTYVETKKWTNKWQNFIATPNWEMNETLKLVTKHDML
jgi:hypothetical protein